MIRWTGPKMGKKKKKQGFFVNPFFPARKIRSSPLLGRRAPRERRARRAKEQGGGARPRPVGVKAQKRRGLRAGTRAPKAIRGSIEQQEGMTRKYRVECLPWGPRGGGGGGPPPPPPPPPKLGICEARWACETFTTKNSPFLWIVKAAPEFSAALLKKVVHRSMLVNQRGCGLSWAPGTPPL